MIYNRIPVMVGGLRKINLPPIMYQYDQVQKLILTDIDLPESFRADFCNEGDTATITMVGTADGVEIPNQLLQTGKPIKAFIVLSGIDANAVQTRIDINIPVNKRPPASDIAPTPAQQTTIDTLIEAMNTAVEDAETAEQGAKDAQQAIEDMTVSAETLAPGSAATVTKSIIEDVVHLLFGIPKGQQGEKGDPGEKGDTGNGIASITLISTVGLDKTYRIAYTNGNHFDYVVKDGAKGDTGNGIASIAKTGTSGKVDTYTITYTNGNTTTFTVTNGTDGEDGVSPGVTITTITGGHRVTITDADHPSGQSFDVMDGQNTDAEHVTYDSTQTFSSGTVGKALTQLNSEIIQQTNNAIDGSFVIPQSYIEQGAYSGQGVPIEPPSKTRIRTKYPTYVKSGSSFTFTAGSVCNQIYWFFFTDSGTLETSGAWVNTVSKTFTEDGYLHFTFRASDQRNIKPVDFDATVTVKTCIANTLFNSIPYAETSVPFSVIRGYPASGSITLGSNYGTLYFPCYAGIKYSISRTVDGRRFRVYRTTNVSPTQDLVAVDLTDQSNYVVTAQDGWSFILVYFYNSAGTTHSYNEVLAGTFVKTITCIDQVARGYLDDLGNVAAVHKNDYYKATVFRKQRTSSESFDNAALSMVFFTDVHNDISRVTRFVNLANAWGNTYINVAVNGGDTTATIYDASQLAEYDTEISNCDIPVLNTVGNHDVYETLGVPLASQTTVYNAITAKVAENVPSIVQPADAAANGLNYYYYDKDAVRIIVLDCMYWDAAELSWFESVLADAVTNSKAVIAVAHYNFVSTAVDYVDSIWNPKSYDVGGSSTYQMPIAAAQAVKTFQDNGGEFIIWLCGHSHGDAIKKLKAEYGTQYQLICPAFVNRASTVLKSADVNAYNYDCLTYLVVDTHYKIVRVMRIGANINMDGAEYHGFSINYGTGEFLHSY